MPGFRLMLLSGFRLEDEDGAEIAIASRNAQGMLALTLNELFVPPLQRQYPETRVDPTRDTLLVDSTPIDYLDFASPVSGLGSKMGLDATHKWPGETSREWGRPLQMSAEVTATVISFGRPWVCE